jgi:NitT/TauT family transport system permease protein
LPFGIPMSERREAPVPHGTRGFGRRHNSGQGEQDLAAPSEVLPVTQHADRQHRPWRSRIPIPYAAITLVVLIVLWQIAVVAFAIPKFLLPSPLMILRDLIDHWDMLLVPTLITTYETVLGFAFSVLIGVPIAVALTSSKTIERAFYPLIVASQAVPKVSVAPLFLIWLGYGLRPKIVIVILVTFFPIVINSVVGLKSLSVQMHNLARSMGSTSWQIFWRFQLPNALPGIFAGLKVASVLAIIGAIVAEFVGADTGLGYVIMVATGNIDIARQFSAIVLLSAIGIGFFAVIERIERLCMPWHISVLRDQVDT